MNKKHSSQNYIRKTLMAICCLFVISCFIPCSTCHAQTGTWRTYMAYSDIQQIVKGNQRLYVRASNNLYSYNLNDQSITTYDKINQLSDNHIDRIVWNPTVNKLLILYQNKNIDLLNQRRGIQYQFLLCENDDTGQNSKQCLRLPASHISLYCLWIS